MVEHPHNKDCKLLSERDEDKPMKFVEFTSSETGKKILINLDTVTDILPRDEKKGTTFNFTNNPDEKKINPKIDVAEPYKVVFAMINERQAYFA